MGVIVVLVAGIVAAAGHFVLDDVVAVAVVGVVLVVMVVAVVGGVPLGLRSDHTPPRN